MTAALSVLFIRIKLHVLHSRLHSYFTLLFSLFLSNTEFLSNTDMDKFVYVTLLSFHLTHVFGLWEDNRASGGNMTCGEHANNTQKQRRIEPRTAALENLSSKITFNSLLKIIVFLKWYLKCDPKAFKGILQKPLNKAGSKFGPGANSCLWSDFHRPTGH